MVQKKYFTEVVLLTKTYNLQDFKDWLHWHLNIIGFQHAHIFDNESSVDIKSVCDSYGDRVSYELITGWPNQYALYNRYINNESPAWWVLPIDDDEYLWVSNTFKNNVNNCLYMATHQSNDRIKISVGWRNLFPLQYTENRINEHIVLNSTGWSDNASNIWQRGNKPVKTFVLTTATYEWSDRIGHSTHDPLVNGKYNPATTIDHKQVNNSWQDTPTDGNADMILFHYQFRCNSEWVYKCKHRVSAGAKRWDKNHPELYKQLYNATDIKLDNRMVKLWH